MKGALARRGSADSRKTTGGARHAGHPRWSGLILGLVFSLALPATGLSGPNDEPVDERRRAKPNVVRPGRGMLRTTDLKKKALSAPGRQVQTQKGSASGQGGGEDDGEGQAGEGAGKEAGDGGSSPWTSVDLPDELAVGIEYKRPGRGTKFSFNLVDADLIELIKIIGNITGKSFILGGKIPNIKATIYAPTRITAGEAYQAFLSVLQVNGLTVMPAGRYLKILPTGGSTQQNTPVVGRAPGGDQIVTQLYELEHVAADKLAELLDRFKSSEGDVTVYTPTNTLIITDYGASIRRLLKLVRVLDQPGTGERIWIEPINYADAAELADRIMEIFDVGSDGSGSSAKKKARSKRARTKRGRAPSGPGVFGEEDEAKISKIIADQRTNSLVIVASETSYVRILELIKQLDVPIAGEGTLHVHKLQHADATELAKTLNNLARGMQRSSRGKKGKKGGGDVASLFEGEMQISADEATNSLVIVSTLRDYLSLKPVIQDLDTMKRQVFVEAVIMEVSLDKNRDLGFGFHAGNTFEMQGDQALMYGSSQPNSDISSLVVSPGTLSGLAAGLRGPELPGSEDLIGISVPAFGVAMQALQTNSDVNVLSTPHILATDNVEASITVGENVPIQQGFNPAGAYLGQALSGASGQRGNTGASSALGAMASMGGMGGFGGGLGYSIGRQNVGITLKITPYINDDNQVRLEIDLEISEVKSVDSNLGPNISKQNANTTSVVADQQTIVIGGLITDNHVETTKKVPVLGDIPILGVLFRSKKSIVKKRNLMIFLTPYIIRTAEDFREIFRRKMAERREFIERYTAFEYERYEPHLDWSRTNGAVSVINSVVTEAREEKRLEKLSAEETEATHEPKQPIELPEGFGSEGGGDEDYEDEGGDEGGDTGATLNRPLRIVRPGGGEEGDEE
jgi:general secretion pathway protein D